MWGQLPKPARSGAEGAAESSEARLLVPEGRSKIARHFSGGGLRQQLQSGAVGTAEMPEADFQASLQGAVTSPKRSRQ
jgi:hypothetical protein